MSARFDLVTLDAAEPERVAAFWSAAIGLVEVEREDDDRWIVLAEPTGERRIGIQRGRTAPSSIHLDLACTAAEFDGEVERLQGLGADVLDVRREPYGRIANLRDPFGNAFDLCAYD